MSAGSSGSELLTPRASTALGSLFDLVPECLVLRGRDGRILTWNAAAERLYGRPRAEVAGLAGHEVFAGDPAWDPALLDPTGEWRGEVTRTAADGSPRTIRLHWQLVDGGLEILEIGHDITLARAAEEALRKSEHRYRNLFQAMAASFWELDFYPVGEMLYRLRKTGAITDWPAHFAAHPEFVREMMRATRVIDVNDQTVALFGRGDKQALLTSVEPFWPEASSPVFAASVVAAVTGAQNYATETRLRTIDGVEFPALFTACFPPDTMNKGTLLIGVIDLTERVAAQEALARMQNEMAHASRVALLGELSASIAHEVNQPLGAIAANGAAGMRWLSRNEPDLGEVRALTERIISDAQRAAEIVKRVRTLASGVPPERLPVSLNATIRDAATFLQHEIRDAGVSFATRLSPDSPVVQADRVQLQQVVVILTLNALQAMSGAGSTRPALTIRTATEGDEARLEVEDNGPGIPEEARARVFDSFFTTKPGGMGLGLAIAQSILRDCGGSIGVETAQGGGARFVVRLPLCENGSPTHTKV